MASSTLPARMPQPPPPYSLSQTRYSTSIQIGGWSITATKRPILSARDVEAAEKRLALPLPEMTFGDNSLHLTYSQPPAPTPASSSTPITSNAAAQPLAAQSARRASGNVDLHFEALEALAAVGVGEGWEDRVGGGVLVANAEHWGKNRRSPSLLLTDAPLPAKPVKPHDWTFSTCHTGSIAGPSKFKPSTKHALPLELLARQDPVLDQILYYAEVPLFEDELHDNGESILSVRIRVMPHCFFILHRLFLRVDKVVFRILDTRIYHSFGSGEVIKEVLGMEADYESIKAELPKQADLSPLTDPNFVHRVMISLDGTGNGRSLRRGKPWPGLGRRVEVLSLSDVDDIEQGVEALQV